MFKNILVSIHLQHTESHKKMLNVALKVLDDNGKITLLFVNENREHGSRSVLLEDKDQEAYNHEALIKLKEIADSHSIPREKVTFRVKEGVSHQEIIEEANMIKADTILIMASRPGLKDYFIGTTAERVIRHVSCSVITLRDTDN